MFILQVGKSRKLGVEFTNLADGEDPGGVTWVSDTPAVATVAVDGQSELLATITGVSVGAATVTATPSNTDVPAAAFPVKIVQVGPHAHIEVREGL